MTRLLIVAGGLLLTVGTAHAQMSPNDLSIAAFNPDDAVAPASGIEGNGIKIGEGTVLRPVFGAETGVVSNVFFTHDNPQGAGLLRLLAQVGTASLGAARLTTTAGPTDETDLGSFVYRANVRASYDFALSQNNAISSTGGLGLGASFHGLANPMGRFSFGVDEDFTRLIRAANFETDANTNRDINELQLTLLYHPRDRSFGGYLYYNNKLDIFERNQQNFADRMFNRVGLHPTWRWLPQTQVYGDVSIGVVNGLSSSTPKATSYPLVATLGLATLLSIKTTFNIWGGYTNGFYSRGPSFSAPTLGALLGYRYSPLGRATLGYQLLYQDSINANYYRDHVILGSLQQQFDPFSVVVQPEVHFRQYNGIRTTVPLITGPDTRDDIILSVVAGIHYSYRNWFLASLNYRFSSVQTKYSYMINGVANDPSYVRHELLFGIRVAM